MAYSLGEKIRLLRKELKMTQTDLAGNEMTKSMLSQIENNSAMPSMKNLQYLASRLNRPASYFLEEDTKQSSLPLEEIHVKLKNAAELESAGKFHEALLQLEEIEKDYNFDKDSKLYADFLSKYGECLIDIKKNKPGEDKLKEAAGIYIRKYLYIEAAKTHQLLLGIPWNDFDYKKCLEILEEAKVIYKNSINKDYSYEIETLYTKSILHAGLDQLEESISATERALEISKQTKIFYRSDELYKNMAILNFFMDKVDHFEEYMAKAHQYAAFTDNSKALSSLEGILAMRDNQLGEPEKALEHLKKALELCETVIPFIYSEMAKTYYILEKYEQALEVIALIQIPDYGLFKYDYLLFWKYRTYEGLCLSKLGRHGEALEAVKQGIKRLEVVGESKTLAEAYRTLSDIYSETGDYEDAFSALKTANKIEEAAVMSKLYY